MNSMDRDLLIDGRDELAARRDEQAAKATQAGLPGAFAELYAPYSPRLYKEILAITRDPGDAKDAQKDTFLRVHLRLRTFEGRSGICTLLTRITINSALMILRRRTRPETLFDPCSDSREEATCFEVCAPFARCIDKVMPFPRLLGAVAECLGPNQVPDYGA
jgi:DNA-directed RNA polymerase specialized sigma24 family protein